MMLTVTIETTHHAPHTFLLNAPASVLTLNESSVDGFKSNFFSILRMELIVTKTSAERVLLLENKNRTKSVRILERGKQTEKTLDRLLNNCSDSSSEWGTTRFC